jgi:hypothetical protein
MDLESISLQSLFYFSLNVLAIHQLRYNHTHLNKMAIKEDMNFKVITISSQLSSLLVVHELIFHYIAPSLILMALVESESNHKVGMAKLL